MVLDATPGASTANSFTTRARADELLSGRLFIGAWPTATNEQKDAALIWATTLISTGLRWLGVRTSATQALAFPRTGLTRDGGTAVDSTTIPLEIELATADLAMRLLTTDLTAISTASRLGLTELTAGPVKLKFQEGFTSSTIPTAVLSLIPLLWYSNAVTEQVTALIEVV